MIIFVFGDLSTTEILQLLIMGSTFTLYAVMGEHPLIYAMLNAQKDQEPTKQTECN